MARAPIEAGRTITRNGKSRVVYKRGNYGLRKTLRAIEIGERTEIRDALQQYAYAVRDAAKSFVRVLRGRLRDAIEARVDRAGLSARIGIFQSSIRRGILHHNAEEFGTRYHRGKAYLWPAAEQERAPGLARMRRAIVNVLRRSGNGR